MKQIAIIGSPGAGKSTFARQLGDITAIEVFHLDSLFWKPRWVETPKSEWIELQHSLVKRPTWIIDGNYAATMDIRIDAADTVIFLDFARRVCLYRVAKRVLRYHGQTRPDLGKECPEKIDIAFLWYIWGFRKREHETIAKRLHAAKQAGKQVIRLKTRREVAEYLASFGSQR